MDALEARDVPAWVYWTGAVSADAQVADNWLVPEEQAAHRPPASTDDVWFDGRFSLNRPCDGFSGDYQAVWLGDGFIATVTLSGPLTAGALNVASGTIDQPVDGTDITVTGPDPVIDPGTGETRPALVWSGGTLNSTDHLANVSLLGGTALIDPGGGTLMTGSNLSFVGTNAAVEATVQPGTVQFNNVAGVVIGAAASLLITPTTDGDVNFVTLGGQSAVYIRNGGTFRVTGPGVYATDQNVSVAVGGTFKIDGGAYCNVTGVSVFSSVYSQGELDIENDSTLQGAGNITAAQGRLVSLYRAGSSTNRATIVGNLVVMGADVIIGESPGDHVFGQTLYVQGNVSWDSGVYRPYLNYAAAENDQWISTGVFRIYTNAKFGPVAVNAPGANPGPWNVIWGIGGVLTETDFTAANFEIAGWSARTVLGPPDPQNPGQALGQAVELRVN